MSSPSTQDWDALLRPERSVLVLGNPPWVTNAAQGRIGGTNLPQKGNFDALAGIAALTGKSNTPTDGGWRSGVKHDCAAVMELRREGCGYRNALGERVDLEETYLYPLLKSSDVANGRAATRFVLLTQRTIGEPTEGIAARAPRTWDYLQAHAAALDARSSRIYRGRPRFSVFGVGPYTFKPWKVAVSGLYKGLEFRVVGPSHGRSTTVLDDTCYFLACASREEAESMQRALSSDRCRRFLSSLVFLDEKRPITVDVLRRLDLDALVGGRGLLGEAGRGA